MKKNKYKALIVTWYNSNQNYGQTLQAYALQKVLNLMKIDAITLTYNKQLKGKNNWKDYYKYKFLNEDASLIKKIRFSMFIFKNMRITRPCNDIVSFQDYINKNHYDFLICGSDQIWNPIGYTKVLVLGVKTDAKKIAYAVSLMYHKDIYKYDLVLKKMSRYLNEFHSISVREKSAVNILKYYINCPIKNVLDPTLLLSRKQWDKIRKHYSQMYGSYLFCYILGEDKEYQQHIECIMKKHNLKKVFMIDSQYLVKKKQYYYLKNIGPSEWVGMIASAGVVLTDSFHGTAFSIIYGKEFYCVKRNEALSNWNSRKGSEAPYSNPDRIRNLLQMFHLSDREIVNVKDIFKCSNINWSDIENILKIKQKESIQFLKDSMKIKKS